ncbi:MAG: hypothetical protein RIA65_17485 [Woeseia sp.]
MHFRVLGRIPLYALLLICSAIWVPIAHAQNYSNIVRVCNKGNADLIYVKFSTNSGTLFTGENGLVAGWYTIKPGECPDVNYERHDSVALGFLQRNDQGITGNPVYTSSDAAAAGKYEWAPSAICVKIGEVIDYSGGLGAVQDKFLPPCRDGHAEFRMSFGVKPNDGYPEFNLRPMRDDALIPWNDPKTDALQLAKEKIDEENAAKELDAKEIRRLGLYFEEYESLAGAFEVQNDCKEIWETFSSLFLLRSGVKGVAFLNSKNPKTIQSRNTMLFLVDNLRDQVASKIDARNCEFSGQ